MIASVRGEVLEVALDHVVIEAAGVGYRVNATPSTLATLRSGSEARLITAMVVREDSMTLYGFPDAETRDLFLTLLSVSGVGPRLAMATLAVHDAAALRLALHDGDVAALTRVPGIGKRGAERMVLELRDKVGGGAAGAPEACPRALLLMATRCGVRWWKPWSGWDLPPSRPRKPPTRCWPPNRTRRRPARCGPPCPCWVSPDDRPRFFGGLSRSRPLSGADGRRGRYRRQPRPRSLGEFIGQPRVREQLQLVIEGAKNRGGTPDHILLSGPPGLGKTAGHDHRGRAGPLVAGDVGLALERAGDWRQCCPTW